MSRGLPLIGWSAALRVASSRGIDCSRPTAISVVSTDDPPYDISGNGMPVMGMIPMVIPTLTKTWNISMAAMPPATRVPYKFFESVTIRSAREIPVAGEPADVVEIVERYGEWLARSPVPKLFINAEPGALITGRAREYCRAWPNQREVTVKGIHYVQEDSPNDIGVALRTFIKNLRGSRESKADSTTKR